MKSARGSKSTTPQPSSRLPIGRREIIAAGFILPLIMAAFFLLYRLEDIAGLHRDEATFGLVAEQILAGARPLAGYFNYYTSPVHSYLIALTFALCGESIFSLRLSGVVFNWLTVVLYMDLARRFAPRAALPAVWLLVTLPVFTAFARMAGENYALNAFFLVGGIWMAAVTYRTTGWHSMGWCVTGFLFFLGCWNHIIFVPAALSVVVVFLLAVRPTRIVWLGWLWRLAVGAFVAAIPKLAGVLSYNHPLLPSNEGAQNPAPLTSAFLNMIYTLGGDGLFVRLAGEVGMSFNWVWPLTFLLVIVAALLWGTRDASYRVFRLSLLCVTLCLLGTWLITPAGLLGPRIWLLPLWMLPAVLALALVTLPRVALWGTVVTLSLVGLLSLYVNYFALLARSSGKALAAVYVGGRYDNSWDYIDMRPLARKLQGQAGPIFIQDVNEHRLWFLMGKDYREKIRLLRPAHMSNPFGLPRGAILVIYRPPKDKAAAFEYGLEEHGLQVRNDLSTEHHLVLQVRTAESKRNY